VFWGIKKVGVIGFTPSIGNETGERSFKGGPISKDGLSAKTRSKVKLFSCRRKKAEREEVTSRGKVYVVLMTWGFQGWGERSGSKTEKKGC